MNPFNAREFDVNFKTTPSPVEPQAGLYDKLNTGYAGAIGAQQKTPQLLDRWDTRFGVPNLQERVTRGREDSDFLGNQIRGMPESIAQRSQESILTQGQKDRQVQAESAPLYAQKGMIDQNVSRDTESLGLAQTSSARMVSAEQVDQEKELAPWLKKYETENIMGALRMTGWTFENKSELDRLLANQNAGVTLSNSERDRMNTLAIAEKGFENAIKLAGINNASAQTVANINKKPTLVDIYKAFNT